MMQLKALLTRYPVYVLVFFYALVHLALLNVNVAEWGDSYRILRAALYIDKLSYPENEKRPPLFSALISLFPQSPDPVLWGRVTVFGLGVATFAMYLKLLRNYLTRYGIYSVRSLYLGGLLFMFNPILFYWSLRIMSDVLFLFLVILAFYVYSCSWPNLQKALVLGLVAGLSVLTRFEGYLLFGALGLDYGIAFLRNKNPKYVLVYGVSFLILYLPFVLWRNPFTSSYLEEPGDRVYDLNTLLVFLLAFLFSLGFVSAPHFFKVPKEFVLKNLALSFFLVLDFILVLLWPAAVPRLLMPLLPFFIIFVVAEISIVFNKPFETKHFRTLITGGILLAVYVIGQYYYKQQFLIVNKYVFIFVVLLSCLSLAFMFLQKGKLFYLSVIASTILWSGSIIYLHKDMYTTLIQTADYMLKNIKGNISHNDTAAVLAWNIEYRYPNDAITGDFVALYNDDMIDYNKLIEEKKYDYLIVTNEEKPFFTFHPKDDYLDEVFSTSKYTNGALYTTTIYKIKYE